MMQSVALQHSNNKTPKPILVISLIRTAILLTFFIALDHSANINFSLVIGALITFLGVQIGTRLAFLQLKFRGLILLSLFILLVTWIIFNSFYLLPLGSKFLFSLYGMYEWSLVAISLLLVGIFSSWAFWSYRTFIAFELLVLTGSLLTFFAGHRNYRFDSSKTLNQLAWLLEWHPLVTLVTLGLAFGTAASLYLLIVNNCYKSAPVYSSTSKSELHSRENIVWSLASGVVLAVLFIVIAWIIFQQQTIEVQARLNMGVGEETNEGLSPLTFQSALGASAQPAAIVRLENDYPTNPYTPMLYLREAALSEFNGIEMVQAHKDFNPDVPIVYPGEQYNYAGSPDDLERMPITQSIYLLADHKQSFAIDYPLSIVGLTLPKGTNKFKRAFRAYSMAPTFKLEDIDRVTTGNLAWTKKEQEHFTKTHVDVRYHELARKIVGTETNPVVQARLLVEYLNTKAIYTLTPGHTAPKGEDQTAPFLFGDLRGYCVHFAHAMVYMLRSLKIPARIATGYLTDLSQSKDGHILLRMSDRHAWSEVFITGKGWVPFDVEPQQVEVHAESPVDLNLLEELMDLLGSSEEILPKDILKDEKISEQPLLISWVGRGHLYYLLALIVLLIYSIKAYLKYGYYLPGTARQVARRSLNAVNINMAELGIYRNSGETTNEFIQGLIKRGLLRNSTLVNNILSIKYCPGRQKVPTTSLVDDTNQTLSPLKEKPYWQKVLNFLNPFSLVSKLILVVLILANLSHPIHAEDSDPLDPFAYPFDMDQELNALDTADEHKSAEQLIREAILLQYDSQLLESRTKLLKALQKDPKEFRAHMALADYYTRHVGHFRLALKYSVQANKLLVEKYGQPPYKNAEEQALHGDVLSLLSQARLNLDDYEGALSVLEEFEKYGYFSSYHPSSKAWILMKLGRLEEAIKVARIGLLAGANPGHTLNILGILLSMTGERQAAITTFQEALRYEMSLGELGNPSTPLNNSGEVFKELFREDNARQAWLSAIQLPDGCEHVLPSLNLFMLYMDELNTLEAKKAIDSFEACTAQYPLKNGEEHRALVKMARARIALHSGLPETALTLLKDASEHQQWFGKIGTTVEDLQLGIFTSLYNAYNAHSNQLRLTYYDSWIDYLKSLNQRLANFVKARWAARKARELIAFRLNFLEDLFIRNTDSMLEYPSLGSLLASFPRRVISSRITDFLLSDKRGVARSYYELYMAEIELNSGSTTRALELIESVLSNLRKETDLQLKAHALNLKLHALDGTNQSKYNQVSYDLLATHPASIANNGHSISINTNQAATSIASELDKVGLVINNTTTLPIIVDYKFDNGQHKFELRAKLSSVPNLSVSAAHLADAVNKLKFNMFTKEL